MQMFGKGVSPLRNKKKKAIYLIKYFYIKVLIQLFTNFRLFVRKENQEQKKQKKMFDSVTVNKQNLYKD